MQSVLGAGVERRKSARHARQRFEEEEKEQPSSSSSSSSECERASSSSSSSSSSECGEDDEHAAMQPSQRRHTDPLHPLYPQPKYGFDDKKRKRGRIGRPMHKGDDEGREPAKRVRRPPPPPPEESLDHDGDEEEEGDENEDMDDGNEDDEDDDDDAVSLGASDSHSSSSRVSSSRRAAAAPLSSSQRASQRIVTQSAAAAASAHAPHAAEDADMQEPAARPHRACASVSAQQNHKVRLSKCWLCTFANCKMARRISEFVSASAGTMDPAIMADQIKAEVKKEVSYRSRRK